MSKKLKKKINEICERMSKNENCVNQLSIVFNRI